MLRVRIRMVLLPASVLHVGQVFGEIGEMEIGEIGGHDTYSPCALPSSVGSSWT